jgi:uncharacterized protein
MFYSYQDFEVDCKKIANEIIMSGEQVDYIVGVVRGGVMPAVCLSHLLELPMRCVSWSTFHAQQLREHALDVSEDIEDGKKILLVDDIIDSGRTMEELLDDWEQPRDKILIATLVYNIDQSITPNFTGRSFSRNKMSDWIDFWWEKQ